MRARPHRSPDHGARTEHHWTIETPLPSGSYVNQGWYRVVLSYCLAPLGCPRRKSPPDPSPCPGRGQARLARAGEGSVHAVAYLLLIARSARLRTSAPPGDLLPRPTFSRIVKPSRGLCHTSPRVV